MFFIYICIKKYLHSVPEKDVKRSNKFFGYYVSFPDILKEILLKFDAVVYFT
jgi:hypothetical protein